MATSNWSRRPRLRPDNNDREGSSSAAETIALVQHPSPPDALPFSLSINGGSEDSHHNSSTARSVDPKRAPRLAMTLFGIFIFVVQVENLFSYIGFKSKSSSTKVQSTREVVTEGENSFNEGDGPNNEEVDSAALNTTATESAALALRRRKENRDRLNVHFELPQVQALPMTLLYYANVAEPRQQAETPVFWHIPRSGGSSIKEMAAQCLKLVQASDVGIAVGPEAAGSKELTVVTDLNSGARYVNVDTTWTGGIERARSMGLASSNLADLIVTPYVYEVGSLFDSSHRGRLFTIMRHPIERAVSVYYTMRDIATRDEHMKKLLNGMSLEQYAASEIAENNWMTRFLSNRLGGELTPEHEALAREVLARKFIVGLLPEKQQSIERFIRYFGWKINDERAEACVDRMVGWNWLNRGVLHPEVKEDSKAWMMLEEQNTFDLRLYKYAAELFRIQSSMFP